MFFKTGSTQHPHSFIMCLLTTYCARYPVPAFLGLTGWPDNNRQHVLSTNYMLALGEAPVHTISFNLCNKVPGRYY